MKNLKKIGVCFCFLLTFAFFCGCATESVSGKKDFKATINGVNYGSLTEAVSYAKSGDTIKIYDDLTDHKNVVIDKPLSIKGIISAKQVRPKFYGSITVDLGGESDSASIEDLEIIHEGVKADGINNDTKIGIKLIDGGLKVKSSKIWLDEGSSPDPDASGVVISRKLGSKNTMPITIEGNDFGSYKSDKKHLSGALIVKNGGEFENLNVNEGQIYTDNSFAHNDEGNVFISIDYSNGDMVYSYFVTSSVDELVGALLDCQSENGSDFTLIPSFPLELKVEKPVTVEKGTNLLVDGNETSSLNGMTLIIKGTINVDGGLEDVELKKEGNSSSIIIGENVDPSKIKIS